jgi:hypothetical protein
MNPLMLIFLNPLFWQKLFQASLPIRAAAPQEGQSDG